jgi:hypothetical protein
LRDSIVAIAEMMWVYQFNCFSCGRRCKISRSESDERQKRCGHVPRLV